MEEERTPDRWAKFHLRDDGIRAGEVRYLGRGATPADKQSRPSMTREAAREVGALYHRSGPEDNT